MSITGQSSKLGANFSVLGIGNVEINVVHNQKEHKLTFKDSLHAPDVTANLISISRMDQMGWDVVFGGGKVRFFKDRCEIFTGTLKDGLYLITGSLISNIPTALTARSLSSPVDMSTWHRRFAHFGISRISEATNLVNGLNLVKRMPLANAKTVSLGIRNADLMTR